MDEQNTARVTGVATLGPKKQSQVERIEMLLHDQADLLVGLRNKLHTVTEPQLPDNVPADKPAYGPHVGSLAAFVSDNNDTIRQITSSLVV